MDWNLPDFMTIYLSKSTIGVVILLEFCFLNFEIDLFFDIFTKHNLKQWS
jgi:hypothetical protein